MQKMKKKITKKQPKKPYVHYDTISKEVKGGLNYPSEKKVCKIGKHKVLLERNEYLDSMGNPVHQATYIERNGKLGRSASTNGAAEYAVSDCLRKNGIKVLG